MCGEGAGVCVCFFVLFFVLFFLGGGASAEYLYFMY